MGRKFDSRYDFLDRRPINFHRPRRAVDHRDLDHRDLDRRLAALPGLLHRDGRDHLPRCGAARHLDDAVLAQLPVGRVPRAVECDELVLESGAVFFCVFSR